MAIAAGLTAERQVVGQFLEAPNGAENINEQLQGVIDNLSLVPAHRPSNMYRSQPAQAVLPSLSNLLWYSSDKF
jgi:hypothetical protein